MTIADCYVDALLGNDSTGDGTQGSPYKSLEGALNDVTGWSAYNATQGGNRLVIIGKQDNAEQPSGYPLSLTAFTGAVTINFDNPLIFEGCTLVQGDGGIAEIDGNNAAGRILTNHDYVGWVNLEYHNFTDSFYMGDGGIAYNCEFYNGGTYLVQMDTQCTIMRCHLHQGTTGASTRLLSHTNACMALFNTFDDIDRGSGVYSGGALSMFFFNIFKIASDCAANTYAINAVTDFSHYVNNTFIGSNNPAGNSHIGYRCNSNGDQNVVLNNLFCHHNSAATSGLVYHTSCQLGLAGYNFFYDNTTDKNSSPRYIAIDLTSNDVIGIDPGFGDVDNGDYSIGPALAGMAYSIPSLGMTGDSSLDPGAVQRQS